MARVAIGSLVVLVVLLIGGALPAFSSPASVGPKGFTVTRLATANQPAAPSRPAARHAVPLRVANPAAYRQQKTAAARRYELWRQRQHLGPTSSAPGPLTAVYNGLNAPGITDAVHGTPSDSTGAIGPDNYVEFINSEIAVYDNTDLSAPTDTLDESTFVGDPSKFTCDVQIQWDGQGQRWLYAALDCGEAQGSAAEAFYFGWSKTTLPDLTASNWCRYKVSTGASLEDYPKLGHDDSQIIVGTNAFADDGFGDFTASHIWVFDKPANGSITCPSESAERGTAIEVNTDAADFTPVPANLADDSATGYVAAARSYSDQSHIDLYTVGRDGAGGNAVLGVSTVTVPSFGFPDSVPQPNTNDEIDSSDTRLTQAVGITDPATGKEGIWTQHTIAGSGGGPSVVRWYELEPDRTTPERSGTVTGPGGAFAFNGAISPTGTGTSAVLNYNSGSKSQLVDWRAQDPLASTVDDIQLATSGFADEDFSCAPTVPCRWGDYAGASPDPVNPCVAWGTTMLTVSAADRQGDPQWGTQNAAIDTSGGACEVTARVVKAGSGSGTVTSSPAGISCGSICAHAFTPGASVTLTAAPATGSVFSGWSGACSGTGSCHLTMDQAKVVTATFTLIPETLSVAKAGTGSGTVSSSPAGMSCGSTCSHAFNYGTSVTLTASPATGSSFSGWSGACSGTGSCTVSMTQARSVTATFALLPEILTVTRSGPGTVSSSPAGISCGSACSHVYSYGTRVTLTASPASGSVFTGWSGACSGTGACTVSMTAARAVTATFRPPQTLTVTKRGRGTVKSSPAGISCGSTCSHAFLDGTSVTLTAKPARGRVFKRWSGACSGKRSICTVTMTSALSAHATFVRKVRCTVPKVKGKSLKKAKRALKKHHCRPGKITKKFSKVKKGHVIKQKPRPHRHLRKGARVKLVVSKGRKL